MADREKPFLKLEEIRKCPLCGGDLEEGYLNVPRTLYWDTRPHKWFQGGSLIAGLSWTVSNVPGKRCTQCNFIMVTPPPFKVPETYAPTSFMKKCVKCGREIPIASEECQYCGKRQPSGK